MIVSCNLMAMNAGRQLNIVGTAKSKSTEKLSSGYRINRSADDAAGLAISEKMRRQIRGLTRASENVQDGISFCQVADGALNEMSDILQRINVLAVQSSNDTNSDEDRQYLDAEVQQLKGEIRRITDTTDFNEIKIFKSNYTPEVSGKSNDFQFFNLGGASSSGGALINNVRYTWRELGIDPSKDCYQVGGKYYFNEDKEYKRTLKNGETLELMATKDAELDSISRVYRWKADNSGITINDNTAEKISWSNVRDVVTGNPINTSSPATGDYAFDYHGMKISFYVPPEDTTFDDLKIGINGSGALNYTYWQTENAGRISSSAVELTGTTDNLRNVKLNAANVQALSAGNLRIFADENGITLKSDDPTASYTFTSWADMKTDTGATPAYPIVDWGTKDTNTNVTLDDSMTYAYKDSLTGISFSFKLADEASLSEVIKGLNGVSIKRNLDSDMNGSSKVEDTDAKLEIGMSYLTFAMQNILHDGDGAALAGPYNWNTELSLTPNADGTKFTLEMDIAGSAHTAKYTYDISRSEIEHVIKSVAGLNSGTLYLRNSAELLGYASSAERSQGVKNINPVDQSVYYEFSAAGLHNDYQTKVDALAAKLSAGTITRADYDAGVKQALDDGVNGFVDFITNNKNGLSFKTNYSFIHDVSIPKTNANRSEATSFSMIPSLPLKSLDIQAGAEKGQLITIKWSPLSVGILGMSDTNVASADSAQIAIDSVKKALAIVNKERTNFGAYQNRLEHTVKNLDNVVENTTAAESKIRDTDMAKEMVAFSNANILEQAGVAMLSQSNQKNQMALQLLQ